jgi:excisionase family DNA binding protein
MVDIHEMARILRVPAGWLYRKVRLREVPFVRLGKYIRFEPQKVVEYYQKTGVTGKAPS